MARSRSGIRTARLSWGKWRWVGLGVGVALAGVLVAKHGLREPTERPLEVRTPPPPPPPLVMPHPQPATPEPAKSSLVETPIQVAAPHPLDPVLTLARKHALAFEEEVVDYTAVLTKRERIYGKLGEEQKVQLKIRNPRRQGEGINQGLCVYLRFIEPRNVEGREVIWCDGVRQGKLVAHEGGWLNLTRVELAPSGTLAMMGNKYPITQIGMGKLFAKLIEKGERDRVASDCQVDIRGDQLLDEVRCTLVEVRHPRPSPSLDFHLARIYLDEARHLPLKYEAYLWPTKEGEAPPLEEQYIYSRVKLNVGLTDQDFDPDHSGYQFP